MKKNRFTLTQKTTLHSFFSSTSTSTSTVKESATTTQQVKYAGTSVQGAQEIIVIDSDDEPTQRPCKRLSLSQKSSGSSEIELLEITTLAEPRRKRKRSKSAASQGFKCENDENELSSTKKGKMVAAQVDCTPPPEPDAMKRPPLSESTRNISVPKEDDDWIFEHQRKPMKVQDEEPEWNFLLDEDEELQPGPMDDEPPAQEEITLVSEDCSCPLCGLEISREDKAVSICSVSFSSTEFDLFTRKCWCTSTNASTRVVVHRRRKLFDRFPHCTLPTCLFPQLQSLLLLRTPSPCS